jgi:serine/threonine-protein kinase RsbW
MKRTQPRTVRIDIASRFEMLEMVQTVLTHLTGMLRLDEDAAHYVSVAIRESVVNAIKHGNRGDAAKRVAVEFLLHPSALEVKVHDEGAGFDPGAVPSPLAEENLLKAHGRGIFFMRSFMDEVTYAFPARGGTVVRMLKKLPVAEAEKAKG